MSAAVLWIVTLLFAATVVIVGVTSGRRGAVGPWLIAASGIAAAIVAILAAGETRRGRAARRMQRDSRDLLDVCEKGAGSPPPDAELAAAVAVQLGCTARSSRRFRRAAVEAWETRLRVRLPRVCVTDGPARERVATYWSSHADPPPCPESGHAALYPASALGPLGGWLAEGGVALVSVAAFVGTSLAMNRAGIGRGWGFGAQILVGAIVPGALLALVRTLRRRAGWWLAVSPERARLVRLRRDGGEIVAYDLDLRETMVLIADGSSRKGPGGGELGEVLWRILPQSPVPAIEVFDMDPRVGPWAGAVERVAVERAAPDDERVAELPWNPRMSPRRLAAARSPRYAAGMEENWIAFDRIIDETPAVIGVDLQFAETGADEERPTVLRVALAYTDVQDNGLPNEADFDAVQGIEDTLVDAMTPAGAVFVGRRSHAGEREFFFYGPGGDAARLAAEGLLAGIEGRDSSVETTSDPEWEFYFEELLPEPLELRRAFDAMVVEQFEEQGDPLTVARPVSHFIYFTEQEARERFAAQSTAAGFAAEKFEEPEAEDDEVYGLSLEREDAIDLDAISEVTTELMIAAAEAGGRYDGWEAEVIESVDEE